ncbi:MAG: TetR/AcrR family transcriptional regulator [Candidatus Obscuribacterales bacterium]|nr:TetR/AcrR family transcriptional regulator [Candidatus Obscuribacterales bacterium]
MGRPREFDIDEALAIAGDLFWSNGYDRTSLSDLTGAMKITPPSFYFAFGSKEKLFQMVIDRYTSEQFKFFQEALSEPTTPKVVKRLLYGFADIYTETKHPPGCLALNSSLPCSNHNDPIRQKLAEAREQSRVMLCSRFKEAKSSGDLPTDADPSALARYVLMLVWGLAVEAQSGASRNQLRRAADAALRSWIC